MARGTTATIQPELVTLDSQNHLGFFGFSSILAFTSIVITPLALSAMLLDESFLQPVSREWKESKLILELAVMAYNNLVLFSFGVWTFPGQAKDRCPLTQQTAPSRVPAY
jgi:uncharacterized membrane protein